MKNMEAIKSQAGFTITEMLISIALSLSVMSSVMVGYLATYTSSMDTLAASKMNQDINAVMALMISELRRSGYSGDAATATNPTTNVFNQVDNTAMEVFDSVASNVQMVTDLANGWINTGGSPAATQGTCIVYAYDADEDGVVDTEELGGFRLNNGAVDFRR
ncbi:MAG: prepilin-type N-terminal cleavage/methylation domain-containing protein, partial [Gammaproteobacteria bacterium]|nr:prepilin-type N-terminal cleavage/methylation domain-containing protein [Gammaproteobacteria bacterium]